MSAPVRLQRFLAEAGIGSRRHCEELITQGRVEINGHVVTALGTTVDPATDRVRVDGEGIHRPGRHVYLLLCKPRGVMTTASDPKGRPTVYSLLPELGVRVHPVGRLDFQTEGLLLFTNDGDLTEALTHPSSGIERVYEAKVQGGVPEWAMARLVKGVRLEDGVARAARCERLRMARTNEWVKVTMTEGRWREVRRMFSTIGLNVLKLRRVRFGPLALGSLREGSVRELRAVEVDALRAAAGLGEPVGGEGKAWIREEGAPRARADRPRPAGRKAPVAIGAALKTARDRAGTAFTAERDYDRPPSERPAFARPLAARPVRKGAGAREGVPRDRKPGPGARPGRSPNRRLQAPGTPPRRGARRSGRE